VVEKTATSNEVVVFNGTDEEWLDWKTLASNYFIPYSGIRKYRYFVFQVLKIANRKRNTHTHTHTHHTQRQNKTTPGKKQNKTKN
jgi:hypothetical protein